MSQNNCSQELFLIDVANHDIKIISDNDLYRHIRLSNNGSSVMRFDLITWPGSLCYTGDMGTYVFSRVPDMFNFFRGKPEGDLQINPHYWHEKLDAVDRDGDRSGGAAKIFSYEKFCKAVREYLDDYDASDELRQEVEDQVIFGDDNGVRCYDRATEFHSEIDPDFEFTDFFEADVDEYEFRFIWACYAIVWAIRQYDRVKAND